MSGLSETSGICNLCQWDDRPGDNLIAPMRYCHQKWHLVLGKFESDAGLLDVALRLGTIVLLALATIGSYALAAVGCAIKFSAIQLGMSEHWMDADDKRIATEFKALDKLLLDAEEHGGFSVAKKQPKERNRYENILPNDATRFKHSTNAAFYFNANRILGDKMIASQGPKPKEIAEFWEMIWDSRASAIVKLVNPVENGRDKCAIYWKDATLAPGFTIKVISEEVIVPENEASGGKENPNAPRSIKRVLEMQKGQERRQITQFDLENWPDHGVVPSDVLARHVVAVHDHVKLNPGPIVTHCSAGIGRTGTFAATYEVYDQWLQGNRYPKIIYSIVAHMRGLETGRNGMVQEREQYKLIHTAAKELVTASN